MRVAYFDCFAGAGGDMIVASLLDAGGSLETLRSQLGGLGVAGFEVAAETVLRGDLRGLKFSVNLHGHEHAHRRLNDILEIIDRAQLPVRAADRARKVFTRLAKAEAKVHNVGLEEIHFHEVGAVDSIVDIVGACLVMEQLGIDAIHCSPIPTGSGTILCAHGVLPVPAPAVAEMLKGVPIAQADIQGEATTPTASAIFTALSGGFGPLPPMTVSSVGYGAGTRDGGKIPNLLRVFIGELSGLGDADSVIELSANIDDCSGEVLGATIAKLLSAGAADAWASPIIMKKSRPAWMICALCYPGDLEEMEKIIFCETTTFGIRRQDCVRSKLLRRHETVETPYGPLRVKVGCLGGEEVTVSGEFEDCQTAAASHHVPVRAVMEAAVEAYRRKGRE
jgi:hypothetical protein